MVNFSSWYSKPFVVWLPGTYFQNSTAKFGRRETMRFAGLPHGFETVVVTSSKLMDLIEGAWGPYSWG